MGRDRKKLLGLIARAEKEYKVAKPLAPIYLQQNIILEVLLDIRSCLEEIKDD